MAEFLQREATTRCSRRQPFFETLILFYYLVTQTWFCAQKEDPWGMQYARSNCYMKQMNISAKNNKYSWYIKVTCLITCLLLYWPKIHRFFFISRYFGMGSDSFYFLRLKFSLLGMKILKKKARQTFRPHMGSLFSAINSKINWKFL